MVGGGVIQAKEEDHQGMATRCFFTHRCVAINFFYNLVAG